MAEAARGQRNGNSNAVAYREAAWVLDELASRRAALKTLIHGPKVSNKRKVFALVNEVLKYRAVLQEVVDLSSFSSTPEGRRLSSSLTLVLLYDLLISSRGIQCGGPLKIAMMTHRTRFKAEFTRLKIRRHAQQATDLLSSELRDPVWMPRWVRVNTLRSTVKQVLAQLKKEGWTVLPILTNLDEIRTEYAEQRWVKQDEHLEDIFAFPPATDLHEHPLYLDGTLILQDKASCFPAAVLGVTPMTEHVIDACAAPGNKTSHLAALMNNQGLISAFDTDARRLALLQKLTSSAGATCIVATHKSFLDVDPHDPHYSNVSCILLDPSCSGSGIVARLDQLVETEDADTNAQDNESRLEALSAFQLDALKHALNFPGVQRVVYSTCSVHEIENELVVQKALATAPSFKLVKILPTWTRRGNPIFDQADCCIRTLPRDDHVIGFFVACFERQPSAPTKRPASSQEEDDDSIQLSNKRSKAEVAEPVGTTASKKKKNKNKKKKKKKNPVNVPT